MVRHNLLEIGVLYVLRSKKDHSVCSAEPYYEHMFWPTILFRLLRHSTLTWRISTSRSTITNGGREWRNMHWRTPPTLIPDKLTPSKRMRSWKKSKFRVNIIVQRNIPEQDTKARSLSKKATFSISGLIQRVSCLGRCRAAGRTVRSYAMSFRIGFANR